MTQHSSAAYISLPQRLRLNAACTNATVSYIKYSVDYRSVCIARSEIRLISLV